MKAGQRLHWNAKKVEVNGIPNDAGFYRRTIRPSSIRCGTLAEPNRSVDSSRQFILRYSGPASGSRVSEHISVQVIQKYGNAQASFEVPVLPSR